ncbi:hypothetical protein ACJMK2_022556 [Sinanodonta woodiana]|uniref:PID domain-containing protein n=1 Tax=Sinanodonta woodiana TaxID=1069815 RepID=A0ABD3TJF8_SINWO
MKGAGANKQWVHPPEALLRGHIVYNVKFLGESEVDAPKGTEVVKESIRKKKFTKHILKAEGQRTPKVELVISVDGVTIQDPKTKIILHQHPLHRISYCADDKSDKKMMTFIAKAADTNQHYCYVFQSDRNAEEITLTIGQAFDMAYRKFLETTGKDHDLKKQFLLLQKKVRTLEEENQGLKKRISELEQLKDRADIDQYKKTLQISNLTQTGSGTVLTLSPSPGGESSTDFVWENGQSSNIATASRQAANIQQTNGTTFNGQPSTPLRPGILSPPPPSTRSRTHSTNTASASGAKTASNPFSPVSSPTDPFGMGSLDDPFGMGSFNPAQAAPQDIDRAIQNMDRNFMDLQSGFSRGLSFGSDDFSLGDLDPLNQK